MFAELGRIPPARALGLLAVLVLAGTAAGAGQEREVVSTRIDRGSDEASLRLEFTTGDPLEISFAGGSVVVDGTPLGASTPQLETAWRALLAQAVTLEGPALVGALRSWSPGPEVQGAARELALRVQTVLGDALGFEQAGGDAVAGGGADDSRALAALLGRHERLAELAAALEGTNIGNVRLYVADQAEVAADEALRATVVMVDGNLVVRGTVEGDVVVVGGTIRLPEGGRITGDVRLADSRLYRDGGEVLGDVVEVDAPAPARGVERGIRDSIREEVLREVRSELGAQRARSPASSRAFRPVRQVVRGVAGVVSSLLTAFVLALIGAAVLHFGSSNLEVVAETARRAPARAAAVGLAGTFLALPAWVLGTVALAITLVGIPLLLVWVPLFPVAVALAAALGYYAVARNVGAWIARQHYPYLGWVRLSNPLTLVAGGVLGLMAAFIVSNALEIGGPWLGFLRGLFVTAGVLVTMVAVLVGLGAVLMTRAGRRPGYYPADLFAGGWDDDLDIPTPPVEPAPGGPGGGAPGGPPPPGPDEPEPPPGAPDGGARDDEGGRQ